MPSVTAKVFRPTARNLGFLASRLRNGELVAVPTETVYGLAANALSSAACARIFKAKGRPVSDPLIVHIARLAQLEDLAIANPAAFKLARAFWPGPLTLVLPKRTIVPDIVTANGGSVAVRMPAHRVFRHLLRKSGLPLAAPSANPFGYVSPTSAQHVRDNLGSKIRYILDGGPARIGLESTIVDLREPRRPVLLRPGSISAAEIARVLGCRVTAPSSDKRPAAGPLVAPGLLARHYSPRTPVTLHDSAAEMSARRTDEAYVFLRKPDHGRSANCHWFDRRGNLAGVARALFATLRRLDRAGYRRLHIEQVQGQDGLAAAINDRLRRAAAR
jgi:L-threonylcarbamoyladenylate synthase